MKRWIALVNRGTALLLAAALTLWQVPTQAQPRVFSQPELEAMLAPVALYPDPVLSNILVAATYPDDVRAAAEWSRANPQLTGEDAVRAAGPIPWNPSVKALLAFPELLARMDESAQWTADLGEAFREQEPYVMDAVQNLRRRAQANGSLQSNDQYSVQQQGSSIAVYPAQPQVVYVPYYDPNVVYGTWWWPAYRPVFWQPWYAHPTVFVSTTYFVRSVDWQRRHIVRQFPHQPVPVKQGPAPAIQHANAQQHWRQQQQWREQQQQNRSGSAPQNRPAVAQDQHSRAQWAEQQARWRDQQRQEVRAPRTNPPAAPAPSTNTNMPQPVVRPISAPVQPIGGPVRNQAQPRQTAPTIHNQPRAAHPFIESVRPMSSAVRTQVQPARQLRSTVEAIRPHFDQRSQHRQSNQPQQRRQAGPQPHRRG